LYDYFEGIVKEKALTSVVLDCGGVGYKFLIPLSTFNSLEKDAKAKLLAYLFVRDDQLKLYGFATEEERTYFEMLISINGVGPALALAVLSGSTTDSLREAILNEDFDFIRRIKGIGLKTAQRIVLELKGSVKELAACEIRGGDVAARNREDACKALVTLGFTGSQAEEAVRRAIEKLPRDVSVEELLRESLSLTR
jgi:Holliday junction DNA helicase RuvA